MKGTNIYRENDWLVRGGKIYKVKVLTDEGQQHLQGKLLIVKGWGNLPSKSIN